MLGVAAEVGPARGEDEPELPAAPLAAIVAYYPPTDLMADDSTAARWARENQDREVVEVFPALDFPEELRPDLSPVNFATPDDPPTLLVHGDADPLVSLRHSQTMLEALRGVGVTVELAVIEGAEHGFENEDWREASDLLVEWFKRHLDG
jgi:dipeptidyl aminopeptidase/acylaminoacyl peptidase